jgi:hypothetical protein
MSDLTEKEQAAYDAMLASYKPTGSFADQGIVGFKRYVKDGVLDEEKVTAAEGLNARQIPILKIELEAAGLLTPVGQPAEEPKKSKKTDKGESQ